MPAEADGPDQQREPMAQHGVRRTDAHHRVSSAQCSMVGSLVAFVCAVTHEAGVRVVELRKEPAKSCGGPMHPVCANSTP